MAIIKLKRTNVSKDWTLSTDKLYPGEIAIGGQHLYVSDVTQAPDGDGKVSIIGIAGLNKAQNIFTNANRFELNYNGDGNDVTFFNATSPISQVDTTYIIDKNGFRKTNDTYTTDTQLVTKGYVDGVAQGLDVKGSVKAASTANIPTLSGLLLIDGYQTAAEDRILVKNQDTQGQNGIYVVASGAWTRATDSNTWNKLISAFVFVEGGAQADTGWTCTINSGGTEWTTPVTWTQFSGAGTYKADGSSIQLAGNTFSLNNIAGLSILGRSANSTGIPAAITASTDGTVLRLSGTSIGFGTLASGAFADNTIAPARLTNSNEGMVLGHSGTTSGPVVAIKSSTQGHVLKVGTSSAVSFGLIANENIDATAAIVDTKLATISTANKVSLSALNINGATALTEALADGDLFGVYNLSATANHKASGTNLKSYIYGSISEDVTVGATGIATVVKASGNFTVEGGQLTVGEAGSIWSLQDASGTLKFVNSGDTNSYALPDKTTTGTPYILATTSDIPAGVMTSDDVGTPSATHYISFVDANNESPTIETLLTYSTLRYVPSTGVLTATEFSGLVDGGTSW